MIDPNTFIRRNPQVVFRELSKGRGSVLLRLDSAAYHGLDEVGTLIWSLLGGGITLGPLLEELGTRFDDVPPNLSADISEFLEDLHQRNLVVLEPARPPAVESGRPGKSTT